jgi:glucosamine--fructose-6-phosphate aminotransferase (isomerizing)
VTANPVALRPAESADLRAIAAVFVESWRHKYRGVVPDHVIDAWDEASAERAWRGYLGTPEEGIAVAEAGGEVVGVVRFRPGEHRDYGYVASLYVHPDHGGAGIGRRLLELAESSLAESGFRAARLWVFEANAEAIGFYQRCGWREDGRTRLEPEYEAPEIGMSRQLGPASDMRAEMAEQPAILARFIERRPELSERLRRAVPEFPRGIVLVARGSSDNAAVYGRYVLELALRRPVALAAPSLWTRYGLQEDLRGYLAIGVSQSGRTPEIVTTLEALRAAGAVTIALTNEGGSPLATVADAAIDFRAGPERAIPATKTFTAQLAAFAICAEALGDPPWKAGAWEPVPGAQATVLEDRQAVLDAAHLLAAAAGSVHLGRGLLYAIALESALKLIETSSLLATGYSPADFLHGPLAVASAETAVVAYLTEGPVAADVRDAIAEVRAARAPVIVVSAEPERDALRVPVPDGIAEPLTPLLHAVRAQQLAAETTLALHRDPDRPSGLRKITLTT